MRKIRLARILQRLSDILPRKYRVTGKAPLPAQPVFIFGSGRNGSTLLNQILNQHSQLFFPPEQYFLGISIIKFKLYNFLIWRDLMKIIAGELIPSTTTHNWNFQPDAIIQELFFLDKKNLQQVIDTIYRAYGNQCGQSFQIWGDTTFSGTHYIPELFSVFPDARFVFLLRDGRDVISSFKAGGPEYFDELAQVEIAAKSWNRSVSTYEWLQKRTKVFLLKYEDLVSDPDTNLKELMTFLSLDFEQSLLTHHQNPSDLECYQNAIHSNLGQPISSKSVGGWKKGLTEEELKQVLPLISVNLKKFNYE